jgi:catechol 2,3-dioxygenase-like lactoylglutathione lyase family enzyme
LRLRWGSAQAGKREAVDRDRPLVASDRGTEQNPGMLSHISLGVRNLERTQAFYDAALAPLGFVRLWRTARGIGYGPPNPNGDEKLALFLKAEADGPLAAGPGFHLALMAPSAEAVDAFHAAAVASGGRDDGRPGLRPQYGETYYAAFVIDPDGHKLEAKRS